VNTIQIIGLALMALAASAAVAVISPALRKTIATVSGFAGAVLISGLVYAAVIAATFLLAGLFAWATDTSPSDSPPEPEHGIACARYTWDAAC
jgi:hypothetical protein